MPRGNPKRKVMMRLDPALIERVKEAVGDGNFTRAVEQAIEAWLKRVGRKPKPTPLPHPPATPVEHGLADPDLQDET
jgi:hypothetical protein